MYIALIFDAMARPKKRAQKNIVGTGFKPVRTKLCLK